jgi:uncharacterized HAD superfamily protein
MIHRIGRFSEVVPFLNKKTLILCDLDYTLVDYGKPFIDFLNETTVDGLQNEPAAYKAFDHYIRKHNPTPTDPAGFIQLMKEVLQQQGKLIFVTARPAYFEAFTRKEFTRLNLDYDFFEVYYMGGQSKGEFCQRYLKEKTGMFKDIFFIDDYKKNIKSFHAFVPDAKTFLFRRVD